MRQCSIIQTFFVTKYSWRLVAEISYELFGRDFVDIWTLFVFLRVWYLYFAWIIYWGQRKCNLFSCYRTVIASFAIVFMLLSYCYYSGVSLYYFQVVELIERTIELHLTSIRLWLVITLYPRETFDNGGLLVSHPASALQPFKFNLRDENPPFKIIADTVGVRIRQSRHIVYCEIRWIRTICRCT